MAASTLHTSVISAAVMRGVSNEATKGNSIFHLLIVIVIVVPLLLLSRTPFYRAAAQMSRGWPQSSRNELILLSRIPCGSAG